MAYPKFVGSSVNPEQLALTVKGLLVGVVPVIILIAKLQGFELGNGDVQVWIDAVGSAIIAVGGAVSTLMTLFGLGRKAYYAIKNRA
jgi:hypothetical protein